MKRIYFTHLKGDFKRGDCCTDSNNDYYAVGIVLQFNLLKRLLFAKRFLKYNGYKYFYANKSGKVFGLIKR